MQTDQIAKIGFGIVVVAAVIGGIATVGGPAKGRMEKRDQARMNDLYALQSYVTCVADARDKTLPDSLTGNAECPRDLDLQDRFNGEPYTYRRLSDKSFELCAPFEAPEDMYDWRLEMLDKDTGCIRYEYIR